MLPMQMSLLQWMMAQQAPQRRDPGPRMIPRAAGDVRIRPGTRIDTSQVEDMRGWSVAPRGPAGSYVNVPPKRYRHD